MEGIKVDPKVVPKGPEGIAFLVIAVHLLRLRGNTLPFTLTRGPAIIEELEEIFHGDGAVVLLQYGELEEV